MGKRNLETMKRDAEMLLLHSQGFHPGRIASQLGVSESTAREGIRRAIKDQYKLEADEMRAVQEERLNFMMRELSRLLRHPKYVFSVTGKIVTGPDGKPVTDASEERQILLAMLKVSESQRKLHGVDQPVKHKVEITDKLDEEIERLARDLAANGPATSVPAIETVPAQEDE